MNIKIDLFCKKIGMITSFSIGLGVGKYITLKTYNKLIDNGISIEGKKYVYKKLSDKLRKLVFMKFYRFSHSSIKKEKYKDIKDTLPIVGEIILESNITSIHKNTEMKYLSLLMDWLKITREEFVDLKKEDNFNNYKQNIEITTNILNDFIEYFNRDDIIRILLLSDVIRIGFIFFKKILENYDIIHTFVPSIPNLLKHYNIITDGNVVNDHKNMVKNDELLFSLSMLSSTIENYDIFGYYCFKHSDKVFVN
jgi:hypothetical protein